MIKHGVKTVTIYPTPSYSEEELFEETILYPSQDTTLSPSFYPQVTNTLTEVLASTSYQSNTSSPEKQTVFYEDLNSTFSLEVLTSKMYPVFETSSEFVMMTSSEEIVLMTSSFLPVQWSFSEAQPSASQTVRMTNEPLRSSPNVGLIVGLTLGVALPLLLLLILLVIFCTRQGGVGQAVTAIRRSFQPGTRSYDMNSLSESNGTRNGSTYNTYVNKAYTSTYT